MADIGDKREKLHIYEFTSALRYFRKNKSDVLKSARDASRYFTWILFLHFKSRIYEWLHFLYKNYSSYQSTKKVSD